MRRKTEEIVLVVMELASSFLSRAAQIIVTAIGSIPFLVVALSTVLGIAPTQECIRNGIIIVAAVNLTAAIPALLEAAPPRVEPVKCNIGLGENFPPIHAYLFKIAIAIQRGNVA